MEVAAMTGGAILIIEDNEDLRDEIVDYLCRRGHAASGCKTLAEAHDFCREHDPAVVVADIHLPDGSGVTFCRDMADTYPDTRWVLMSGNADLVREGNRARTSAFAVIDKPIPLRTLDRFIADATQRRSR
ncbi:response regulator [Vineibacter terrae]|nr:response regulator [Vineibacter terrae]